MPTESVNLKVFIKWLKQNSETLVVQEGRVIWVPVRGLAGADIQKAAKIIGQYEDEIISALTGFKDRERDKLSALRKRIASGDITEETIETKRLLFAQWLYQHGRINEDAEQSTSTADGSVEG